MDIDTDAPVITRDEILISAPIQTIWDLQTDVVEWPSWQPDVDDAEADGPLTVGSVFRWQTAGLDIASAVEEVEPPHRIVWGGPAQGIVAVHVWTLDEQDGGVLVRTAESWEGDPVVAQPEQLQAALDGCVRGWRTLSASQKAGGHIALLLPTRLDTPLAVPSARDRRWSSAWLASVSQSHQTPGMADPRKRRPRRT